MLAYILCKLPRNCLECGVDVHSIEINLLQVVAAAGAARGAGTAGIRGATRCTGDSGAALDAGTAVATRATRTSESAGYTAVSGASLGARTAAFVVCWMLVNFS